MREEIRCLIAKYGYPSVIEALHKEMYDSYISLDSILNPPIVCIYGIFHILTDTCIYVGCSINFSNRIPWHHKEYLLYPQRKLYKLIRESGGWDSFSFKIIEHLDQSNDIHFREKYWIAFYKPTGNSISPPSTLIL